MLSRWQHNVPFVPVLLIALVTSGCVVIKPIPTATTEYNRAIGDAANRVLLLNVLRAAERQPKVFSSLNSINGLGTTGLTPNVSLGLADDAGDRLSLTLPVNRGTATFSVSADHSQEFTQGLIRPVDLRQVAHFWHQGWQKAMLAMLLVERVEIAYPDPESAKRVAETYAGYSESIGCKLLFDQHLREVKTSSGPSEAETRPTVVFDNRPSTEFAQVREFECLVRMLLDLQMLELATQGERVGELFDADGLDALAKALDQAAKHGLELRRDESSGKYGLYDLSPRLAFTGFVADRLDVRQFANADVRSDDDGPRITAVLRSVEGVIHYLGQLHRYQNPGNRLAIRVYSAADDPACAPIPTLDDTSVKVPHPYGCPGEAYLFTVLRERLPRRDTVVRVRHFGEHYSVPLDDAAGASDLSGSVLTFLNQLLGLNRAGSEAPPGGVVLVGVGQ